MERMTRAEQVNRRLAARFVYHEEIRYTETRNDGRARVERRNGYEVSILEGEPYHRLVSVDGEPLTEDEQKAEDKRYREVELYRRKTPMEERRRRYFAAEEQRYRFDATLVLRYHELTLAGEETVAGRRCWIVETHARRGAPKPKRRSQWSLAQAFRYAIDQETLFPVRVEARQMFAFGGWDAGARTTYENMLVDGVWLTGHVTAEGRGRRGGVAAQFQTEQTYSGYKRFSAATTLIIDDIK